MKYNFCLFLSKFVECIDKSVKFGQKEIVAIFTQCMIKCYENKITPEEVILFIKVNSQIFKRDGCWIES